MSRANKYSTAAPALLATLVAAVGIGLVIDFSSAHQVRLRLDQSLRACAVAAARQSTVARSITPQLFLDAVHARMAGAIESPDALDVAMIVDRSADDAVRIRLEADTATAARFGRLLGRDAVSVHAVARAVRRPLDVAVAVDLSYSLKRNGGLAATRAALTEFARYFDDDLDRLALVTYSTWAERRVALTGGFREPIEREAARLEPVTDAATDEGLRVAKLALDAGGARPGAVRAVVLFTDGQPTAFADRFRMPDHSIPRYYQGVVAAYLNGPSYRGLFRQDDGRKVRYFSDDGETITADNAGYAKSVMPKYLPGRFRVDGDNIRTRAAARAESRAALIRSDGCLLYAIGLGGGQHEYAADVPDPVFLRRLANEAGAADMRGPQGRALIVEDPATLSRAFAAVADALLERATAQPTR